MAATSYAACWVVAVWPRFATAGTLVWPVPSRSRFCTRASALEPDNRRRFEAEARAAAALDSAHIVAVHDSGEHNGMPFIVMERLSGESLHDKIMRGPLPLPLVRAVLDDVLAALAAAHDAGILHRDIKPANILFTTSGEAKVSDFGLAKTAQTNLTAAGQVFGTMAYLSPDRVLGKPASAADDIYAVGVMGYEALTGAPTLPAGQHRRVGTGDPA